MRHLPPPLVRGGLLLRLASLFVGLFGIGLGIVLFLEADLGLAPWDVLHQGMALHTPISFGLANVVVGIVCVLLAWKLGERPGLGTIANATAVGAFLELLLATDAVPSVKDGPLGAQIGYLALGLAAFGVGSALYIGAGMGAGPRDSLMLVVARRLRTRVGVGRAITEVTALGIGIALGGTVGVGTLVFAAGVGPAVELGFFALGRSPLAERAAVTA